MNTWLFQGNPKYFRVRAAVSHFKKENLPITWLVTRHKAKIRTGDEVFFWQSGPDAALVGWGIIETDPSEIPSEAEGLPFMVVPSKFEGLKLRVQIRVNGICYGPRA